MRQYIYFIFIAIAFVGCQFEETELKDYKSESLKIEKIDNSTFKHISYLETEDYGKVACNGMVFVSKGEVIIFDTPTNNEASSELIRWIGERDIKAVVVTHFHKDCLGGLEQFHLNGSPSYANQLTIQLVKDEHQVLPQRGFDNKFEFNIGDTKVFAEFFGEGHTKDNIVGYIPSKNVLFGGCLIKALGASKGNLNDANVQEWSETVQRIKEQMPQLEKVIPGHGKSGGDELLSYTIQLFNEN